MTDTTLGQVFFSYSRRNSEFAFKLANRLRREGVPLWMDDGLIYKTGKNWQDEIRDGVVKSQALLAVLSPNYVHSRYCQFEISLATDLGRTIYPVLLEAVPTEQMPFGVSGIQYIDFSNWLVEEEFEKQFEAFVTTLQQDGQVDFGSPPNPERQYLYRLLERLTSNSGVLDYVEDAEESRDGEVLATRPNPFQQQYAPVTFSFRDAQGNRDTVVHPVDAVESMLIEHPRLMMLGKAGAGKTSTLYRCVFDAIRTNFEHPRTAPLPVLIDLSEWGSVSTGRRNPETGMIEQHIDTPELAQFIEAQMHLGQLPETPSLMDSTDELMKAAEKGRVVFFVDGLNELEKEIDEESRLAQLQTFLYPTDGKSAPQRIMVACRSDDYRDQLDLKLPAIVLNDLNAESIRVFAQRHLSARADSFLEQVIPSEEAMAHTHKLYELVQIPFFLSALVYFVMRNPDSQLPQTAAEIVKQLIRILWENKAPQRLSRQNNMTYDTFVQRFSLLAFRMVAAQKGGTVSIDYAWQQLLDVPLTERVVQTFSRWFSSRQTDGKTPDIAEQLIMSANEARILTASGNKVSFAHDLLRDTLAAMYLLHNPGELNHLRRSNISENGRKSANKIMENVINYAFDLEPDSRTKLVTIIAQSDPYLATEYVAGGIQIQNRALEQLINALFNASRSGRRAELRAAGQALVQLGDVAVHKIASIAHENTGKLEDRIDAIRLLGYSPTSYSTLVLEEIARSGVVIDKELEDAERKFADLGEKISYMQTDEFVQKKLQGRRNRERAIGVAMYVAYTAAMLLMKKQIRTDAPIQDNLKRIGSEALNPKEHGGMNVRHTVMSNVSQSVEKLNYKRKEIEQIIEGRRKEVEQETAKLRAAAEQALQVIKAN